MYTVSHSEDCSCHRGNLVTQPADSQNLNLQRTCRAAPLSSDTCFGRMSSKGRQLATVVVFTCDQKELNTSLFSKAQKVSTTDADVTVLLWWTCGCRPETPEQEGGQNKLWKVFQSSKVKGVLRSCDPKAANQGSVLLLHGTVWTHLLFLDCGTSSTAVISSYKHVTQFLQTYTRHFQFSIILITIFVFMKAHWTNQEEPESNHQPYHLNVILGNIHLFLHFTFP